MPERVCSYADEHIPRAVTEGVRRRGGGGLAAPGTDLAAARRAYAEPWVRWNLVRTVASTLASPALYATLSRADKAAHRPLPAAQPTPAHADWHGSAQAMPR